MQRLVDDYGQVVTAGDNSDVIANNHVDVRHHHELGDRTFVLVIVLSAVIAACGIVIGMDLSERQSNVERMAAAEKESRMLQYYVNEVDGKLIHAGFIEPRERWSPEKRKQYEETKP